MSIQTAGGVVPEFDMADRMRKSLRVADVSVQEMADYLEVERNTISRWINGRTHPPASSLRLWAMRTGVDYRWLRNGEEPQPEMAGAPLRGLPRLDLNQRPSDYVEPQVKPHPHGRYLRVVGDRIAA